MYASSKSYENTPVRVLALDAMYALTRVMTVSLPEGEMLRAGQSLSSVNDTTVEKYAVGGNEDYFGVLAEDTPVAQTDPESIEVLVYVRGAFAKNDIIDAPADAVMRNVGITLI